MNWEWGRGKHSGCGEWVQDRTGQQMTFKDSEINLLWQAPARRSLWPAQTGHSERPSQTNSLTVVNTCSLSISHFVYRKHTNISPGVNLPRPWVWILVPLKPSTGLWQRNLLRVLLNHRTLKSHQVGQERDLWWWWAECRNRTLVLLVRYAPQTNPSQIWASSPGSCPAVCQDYSKVCVKTCRSKLQLFLDW